MHRKPPRTRRRQTLLFIDDGSESYETKVENYTASLGQPTEIDASEGHRVHVWEDERTRFELHADPRANPDFWSLLQNRRK